MKHKDRVKNLICAGIILIYCLLCLYPMLNALAVSLNDANDTVRGGLTVYPRIFTIDNYKLLLDDIRIPRALLISIARTVIGTVTSVIMTALLSYGMSKKNLLFRKGYMTIAIIAMYFSGGLIPGYLLINNLGLSNNFWVYILPGMVNVYNMLIMRTFFSQIPEALEESAYLDGAGSYIILFRIILPISMPIVATIALFVGVGQWNSWFDASLYMTKRQDLLPMQSILIQVINTSSFYQDMLTKAGGAAADAMTKAARVSSRSMRMATMIITVVPVLCVYPFLQKYFMKGVMIGSIKG